MFVSARFIPYEDQDGNMITDRQVLAVDETGREWQHPIDCQVGDWLEYLANGGMIDPYVKDTKKR
jgi:hypothetical protein